MLFQNDAWHNNQAELESVREQLRLQTEHANELEAMLADRDARLVSQTHDLNEVESQLLTSTQVVSGLHARMKTNHNHLTQLLTQLHTTESKSAAAPPPTSDGVGEQLLPVTPGVLELVANLDAAYAELQESESRRAYAEHRAMAATKLSHELRSQLDQLTRRLDTRETGSQQNPPPYSPILKGDAGATVTDSVHRHASLKLYSSTTQTDHASSCESKEMVTANNHVSFCQLLPTETNLFGCCISELNTFRYTVRRIFKNLLYILRALFATLIEAIDEIINNAIR